jgi:hypothetical protein
MNQLGMKLIQSQSIQKNGKEGQLPAQGLLKEVSEPMVTRTPLQGMN